MAARVVDLLEVVEVEHHEPDGLGESPRALDLGLEHLVEAPVVEQPGEVVGHRLALDLLVQADVLDRHAGLASEVVE